MLLNARSFAHIQGLPLLSAHTKECHTKGAHISGSCCFTSIRDLSCICWNKENLVLVWFRCRTATVSTTVVSRVTVDVVRCRIPGYQAADETREHKEPMQPSEASRASQTHLQRARPGLPAAGLSIPLEQQGERSFPHVAAENVLVHQQHKRENQSAFGENNS